MLTKQEAGQEEGREHWSTDNLQLVRLQTERFI
jgi:hypothetical protein